MSLLESGVILEAITKDQEWHLANKDKFPDLSADFKRGFIQGMTQAKHVIEGLAEEVGDLHLIHATPAEAER